MASSLKVLWLNVDERGESFFDATALPWTMRDFAPPAPPMYVSDPQQASGYVVLRLPTGWGGEPHPSPGRQILFCLSGAMTVTTSDGDSRVVKAGDAMLMSDTHGKGHQSEVTSAEPLDAVIIRLPDAG